MCSYLARRGSTYYFRRAIPVDLRPVLGKSEFMFSLGTKDRAAAKLLIPAKAAATDRELTAARAALPRFQAQTTTPKLSAQDAVRERASLTAMHEAAEIAYRDSADEEYLVEDLEEEVEALRERIKGRRLVDLPIELQPVALLLRDAEYERSVAEDHLLALRTKGPAGPGPEIASRTSAALIAPSVGHRLDVEIVDRWAKERAVAAKTKAAHVAVAKWFYERVGVLPINAIERRHVLAFKDKLLEEGQQPSNINTKLNRLSSLLQWSLDNDLTPTNPARGIRIPVLSRTGSDSPYSSSELNRIFSSPVYASKQCPIQGRGHAAYWLPLMGLFSGARLEELCQLMVKDVELRDYPTEGGGTENSRFIIIRASEEDDQRLKNAGSARVVPVHPELERLGIGRYLATLDPGGRLFPSLSVGAYSRKGAKWGEWFSKYRRDVCGITGRNRSFHSFRHTFKDCARNSLIAEPLQRQLMGHRGSDVADRYGAGFGLHQLVEAMRRYRVSGINLPSAWEP